MHKKIDLFFNGKYLCSTNQAKTCRDAKISYIGMLENRSYPQKDDKEILANPKKLKAFFDKERK